MKKKLTSFICFLLLATLLLCGCDTPVELDATDGAIETEAIEEQTEKQTEKATESKKPSKEPENNKPEKVDSINGKSAAEIIEKFFSDYSNAKSFDISVYTATMIDNEPIEEHIELKSNGDDLYMLMEADGFKMQVWSVDGMLYADNDGEKFKAQADINDYFGEGYIEMLTSTIPDELHEIYKEKLDAAEITFDGISYSFSVSFSAKEAYEMADLDDEELDELAEAIVGFSETYVVGTDGKVKAILSEYENGSCSKVELESYGKPVTVSAPKNADEFEEIEIDEGGDYGEIDPEAYELYVGVCELLANASSFALEINVVEGPALLQTIFYEVDGEDKYVAVIDAKIYELWIVDGEGYFCSDYDPLQKVDLTQAFLSSFVETEQLTSMCTTAIAPEEMSYMISYGDGYGNTVVEFEITETGECYHYLFNNEVGNAVEVSVATFDEYGEVFDDVTFWFTELNNEDFEIVAPM